MNQAGAVRETKRAKLRGQGLAAKQSRKRSYTHTHMCTHAHREVWKKKHGIKEEGEGASSHRCFLPLKRGFLPLRKKIINTFMVAMPTCGFSLHT